MGRLGTYPATDGSVNVSWTGAFLGGGLGVSLAQPDHRPARGRHPASSPDGGAHCCLCALARSADPNARRRAKVEQVVVATLFAAPAHLIPMLVRPLVLVARMRVHVGVDPESAQHGLLGHEKRYV